MLLSNLQTLFKFAHNLLTLNDCAKQTKYLFFKSLYFKIIIKSDNRFFEPHNPNLLKIQGRTNNKRYEKIF